MGTISSPVTEQLRNGLYEAFLFEHLHSRQIDLQGKIVWDIGAHVGYHSLMFATLVGSGGCVFAFEPNPQNVARIKEHLNCNSLFLDRVVVHHVAVSNENGEQTFRYSQLESESDLGFLQVSGIPSERFSKKTYESFSVATVPVRTLDRLVLELNAFPNVIKIDVEGAEVLVLQGAQNLLKQHKPMLLIEVHNIRAMQMIMKLLHECQYLIELIDDPYASSSKAFIVAQ